MNLKVMRERKYEFTQLSNMSVNYITEKDVLEAIYNKAFEEKQEQRAGKRHAGSSNNAFLTGIHAKQTPSATVHSDIIEKLKKEDI